ncbi:MAG TPA: TetR/AcrR family transcriptional regulator [Acidimicrobiales bacterium]|jgi:AcrR family transcriptional regulator|nr:TetR/AcrR family transcriptional regulator [Acidimicrobiales bacterium]
MPRPKQRTAALRDHVLVVALDRLSREGVGGFTARGVALDAETSTPAVYELFGDKWGLVRALFFEGFRQLRQHLGTLVDSEDPRADLVQLVALYRQFIRENPVLCEVMFSRPFTDFDPGPSEVEASGSVRVFVVEHVGRCIATGSLHGDETDAAHVLVALLQGLAAAERAGRLGTSQESIDRRWDLATTSLLHGLSVTPDA